MTKDDLTELRRETHNYIHMLIAYLVVLWILSDVQGGSKLLLMTVATVLFAALIIRTHQHSKNTLRIWSDLGETIYNFSKDGIQVDHPKGTRQFDWESITSFLDHESAIILNYFEQPNIFIPKRCLQHEELEKLHGFLSQTKNLTEERVRKQKRDSHILLTAFIALLILFSILFALIRY